MLPDIHIQFDVPPRRGKRRILRTAEKFTNFVEGFDGESSTITINKESFAADCQLLLYFWDQICKWKSTAVFIDDQIAPKLQLMGFLACCRCYSLYSLATIQEEYCWTSTVRHGWGCKQLYSIMRHYNHFGARGEKFWYQVGPFIDNVQWIDKTDIEIYLKREAILKCLEYCPLFSFEKVRQSIQRLPDKIEPSSDEKWKIEYSSEPGFDPAPIGVQPNIDSLLKDDYL